MWKALQMNWKVRISIRGSAARFKVFSGLDDHTMDIIYVHPTSISSAVGQFNCSLVELLSVFDGAVKEMNDMYIGW